MAHVSGVIHVVERVDDPLVALIGALDSPTRRHLVITTDTTTDTSAMALTGQVMRVAALKATWLSRGRTLSALTAALVRASATLRAPVVVHTRPGALGVLARLAARAVPGCVTVHAAAFIEAADARAIAAERLGAQATDVTLVNCASTERQLTALRCVGAHVRRMRRGVEVASAVVGHGRRAPTSCLLLASPHVDVQSLREALANYDVTLQIAVALDAVVDADAWLCLGSHDATLMVAVAAAARAMPCVVAKHPWLADETWLRASEFVAIDAPAHAVALAIVRTLERPVRPRLPRVWTRRACDLEMSSLYDALIGPALSVSDSRRVTRRRPSRPR